MSIILDILAVIACLMLIYNMAKPYFKFKGQDMLDDWLKEQKKKNRRRRR